MGEKVYIEPPIQLQVVIGILCIILARLNITETKVQAMANKLNTAVLVLIFVLFVMNVVIIGLDMNNSDHLGPMMLPEAEPEVEPEAEPKSTPEP